jgi:hypothetical protein
VADVVLQEHDLTLVRSAVTLTVNGELDEPDPEDLDDDEAGDDESETYELLVSFWPMTWNTALHPLRSILCCRPHG